MGSVWSRFVLDCRTACAPIHDRRVSDDMAPKRSMTSSQIASKGGKIARDFDALMSEKKKEHHRRRVDTVLEKIKNDSGLCERVSTAVENNLLSGQQTKEPESFGPKCFTLNRVGKNFLKVFLLGLKAPSFDSNDLRIIMSSNSDAINRIFRYVCRVELNYYIGPSLKSEWTTVFTERYNKCGRLLHRLKTIDGGKRIDWGAEGHFRLLPPLPADAANDDNTLAAHKFSEIECHGVKAPLPAAVCDTAAWMLTNNYSLLAAEVKALGDLGFGFVAKVCFKGSAAFDELVSSAWLSAYDLRGQKGGAGAAAGTENNESDDEEGGDAEQEQSPPEPMPKKVKLAPPTTTPDKLSVISAAEVKRKISTKK